jgi:hypothetical protein
MNNSIRALKITETNIKNGSLYLGAALDLFSGANVGGSNAADSGKTVTVYLTGLNTMVKTDIAGDKKIFRKRFWNAFYKHHGLRVGDAVSLWKVTDNKYVASPLKSRAAKKALASK